MLLVLLLPPNLNLSKPTPSKPTPEIKGVNQGFRVAGKNGISKSEFKTIAEDYR
jgi:hypothetical protein